MPSIKDKIDAEMANQQKRAMKNESNDSKFRAFMAELDRSEKEKEFRKFLMEMATKNQDANMRQAALSPETRVETRESKLAEDKGIVNELKRMRAANPLRQSAQGRYPAVDKDSE